MAINLLAQLNEFRKSDITRLARVINNGPCRYKQRNNTYYNITNNDIERARRTILNLTNQKTNHE